VNVAVALLPITISPVSDLVLPSGNLASKPLCLCRLTFERALHFHDFLLLRIVNTERAVDMEVFLHDIEQVVALLVEDLLATRNRHDLALHPQDGGAVCKLDVKVITSKRHDLLFDHKSFRGASKELRENADWRGDLSKVCHYKCVGLDERGSV
jgi:hypothetical protein